MNGQMVDERDGEKKARPERTGGESIGASGEERSPPNPARASRLGPSDRGGDARGGGCGGAAWDGT
jgi:hypothetical protein